MNIPTKELEAYQTITKFFYDIVFSSSHSRLLGWESHTTQEARFCVFMEEIERHFDRSNIKSIIDFGCGYGDLYRYFFDHSFFCDYTGIDNSSECISNAIDTYVTSKSVIKNDAYQVHFINDTIFRAVNTIEWDMCDISFMSGVLNLNINKIVNKDANKKVSLFIANKMLLHSRIGAVCNFLHVKSKNQDNTFCYHDPNELIAFFEENGITVLSMRDDYLPNDFTLVLQKKNIKDISYQENDSAHKVLEMYTDGGCSGNPGIGAWAFVSDTMNVERSGSVAYTTNNKMELQAAIEALQWSKQYNIKKILYTDSQYLKKGITEWVAVWIKKKWKLSTGEPVKNKNLWIQLCELVKIQDIQWEWVKGHGGNKYNEQCHDLVEQQIKKNKNSL